MMTTMKRKVVVLFLGIMMALSLALGLSATNVYASADAMFYNADKTPLTWVYDSNGVSTQTAYKADGTKYGSNGMYSPQNCYGEREDGSVFVLTAGSYIVLAPQDVTKEIVISFTMDPNNAWSQQDTSLGRFLFAAYDNLSDAFTAGNGAYNNVNNEKFTAWGALKENDNTHKLLIANQRSNAVNYNGNNAVFSIKVGETGTDFYFGGEKFATTALKRSDFASGKMYISLIAYDANLEAKVKVSTKEVAAEPVQYYNADKTPLTWAYDSNGVSTQTAYNADGTRNGMNGMYSPQNCYRENADGSVFLLTAGAYTVLAPQDVTKDVEISFTMDPNNAWSNQDASLGRFLFAAYDNIDDALKGGNNAWQGKNNEKFLAWGALKEGESNKHKLEVSWQKSKEVNYNGNNAVFTVKVGETGTDFYFGGEKFATTALKRSDFASGKMYISLIAYDANLEAKVKLINCDHAGKTHADAKAATCTEVGNVEYYFCAQCQQYFEDAECVKILNANEIEIAALGHTEETVEGTAATCTQTGLTEGKKCTVCGVMTVAQEVVNALGHTEETVEGTAATCTQTGLTDGKKCTVCGVMTVAQEVIEATNEHVGGNATCQEEATCEQCGEKYGEKAEHAYENGVCTVCGSAESGSVEEDSANSENASVESDSASASASAASPFGCVASASAASLIGVMVTAFVAYAMKKKEE